MYNLIILSSSLLGSAYIHSKTLELIHKSISERKKVSNILFAINMITIMMTNTIMLYSLKNVYLHYLL
jgi:hypothetical protein